LVFGVYVIDAFSEKLKLPLDGELVKEYSRVTTSLALADNDPVYAVSSLVEKELVAKVSANGTLVPPPPPPPPQEEINVSMKNSLSKRIINYI
tara:strand:- start:885 stop:1163 length:279 start_codon:yes stop_codon:yes gene_type:complete